MNPLLRVSNGRLDAATWILQRNDHYLLMTHRMMTTARERLEVAKPNGNASVYLNFFHQDSGDKSITPFISRSRNPDHSNFISIPISSLMERKMSGHEVTFYLDPSRKNIQFNALMGSQNSLRNLDRADGGDDPDAKIYTERYEESGASFVPVLQESHLSSRYQEPFLLLFRDKSDAAFADHHRYLLRLTFPKGTDIQILSQNMTQKKKDSPFFDVTFPDIAKPSVKMTFLSDHDIRLPYQLDALFGQEYFDQVDSLYHQLFIAEDSWFERPIPTQAFQNYTELYLQWFEANSKEEKEKIAMQIKSAEKGLAAQKLFSEIKMLSSDTILQLPLFRLYRLLELGQTAKLLFSQKAAPLAGAPYYMNPFSADATIVLESLAPYLKKEVLHQQLDNLLQLVISTDPFKGQVAHEKVMIHSSSTVEEEHEQLRPMRGDAELMLLNFIGFLIQNNFLSGYDWEKVLVQKHQQAHRAKDQVSYLINYLLTKRLNTSTYLEDFQNLVGPKEDDDGFPRPAWQDAHNSLGYSSYSGYINVSIVPQTIAAIKRIAQTEEIGLFDQLKWATEKSREAKRQILDGLETEWQIKAKKHFSVTITKQEQIENIVNWYRWRYQKDHGFGFIKSMIRDAEKTIGKMTNISFQNFERFEITFRAFLNSYLPAQPLTYLSLGVTDDGTKVRVPDINRLFFSGKDPHYSFEEIRFDMRLAVTPFAFGGNAFSKGVALSNPMLVSERDRYLARESLHPGYKIQQEKIDLYETMSFQNYHGPVIWPWNNAKIFETLVQKAGAFDPVRDPERTFLIKAARLMKTQLNRLGSLERQEVIRPYINPQTRELDWEPFGTPEKGIFSNPVQLFNLVRLISLLEKRDVLTNDQKRVREEILYWKARAGTEKSFSKAA